MREEIDLKEYGVELATRMSTAWELAKKSVKKAQKRQKKYYDQKMKPSQFQVGDKAFLLKPEERTGEARKLNRPYHGPYRVVSINLNNAHICRVDKPQEEPILVALECLRRCPKEVADEFWPSGTPRKRGRPRRTRVEEDNEEPEVSSSPSESDGGEISEEVEVPEPREPSPPPAPAKGKYTGRLRSHQKSQRM